MAARIHGYGWHFESRTGGQPSAAMLDEILGVAPDYLNDNELHSCWVNSAVLAELGITTVQTQLPIGGQIVRDVSWQETELLLETAAQQLLWPFLEKRSSDAGRDIAPRI